MTLKQAYAANLAPSWYAPFYYDGGPGYAGTYDWENGISTNGSIAKESWLMLREITLGYQVPYDWLKKIKAVQGAKILLYNSLPDHQNPASIQSNNPLDPFITGGVPFERNYSVTLDLKF
jgi:iron complex outermembrane receptor protein